MAAVQFAGDTQETSPKSGGGLPAPANPEQVRKKWDALLSVINNVSTDGADAQGSDPSQRPPLRDARELVSETGNAARATDRSKMPREWDFRHHLLYSKVNARMQKNTRSYFGRMREPESYGLKCADPLRTTWQLETPEEPPTLGTLKGHYAKFNSPQGSPTGRLPALADSPGAGSSQGSPQSTGMSRTMSDPGLAREQGWNGRHGVIFSKDNHHYHANLREYFERPRAILF